MFKESHQVALRFKKAHTQYQEAAVVQKQICQKLMQMILLTTMTHPKRVLEIGCGSGVMSREFLQHFAPHTMYLNDLYDEISTNFLPINTPKYHYLIEDVRSLNFPEELDLVFSTSALQWVYPLKKVLKKISDSLLPSGIVAVASFTQGNLRQIKQLTGQGLLYHTKDELLQMLEDCGLKVEQLECYEKTLYFQDAYSVLKHLQATGVTASANHFRWTKTTLLEFEQSYRTLQESAGLPLTYSPILFIARKL